jgi:hypothetical protein
MIDENGDLVLDELNKYLSMEFVYEQHIPNEDYRYSYLDALWEDWQNTYPLQFQVFLKTKVIPISNTEVERSFNYFRNVFTDNRTNLKVEI